MRGATIASAEASRGLAPHPLLSLPLLVAFGLFSLPVRAMPAASMQVFRLDGNGVRPLPALTSLLSHPGSTSRQTLAQAPAEVSTSQKSVEVPTGTSELSISFDTPFPDQLPANIQLLEVAEDGSLKLLQDYPLSSSDLLFSPDRLKLTAKISQPLRTGQRVILQFPASTAQGIVYGCPSTAGSPCAFQVIEGLPIGAAPAAASTFPTWAIVLGVVVVGVGVAAISGAFSSDGGGGGTNPSSQ